MEININCDSLVKIENLNNAYDVVCSIANYEKKDEVISGNVLITGEFIKDNFDEKYPFSEMVPFEIVFKDSDFKIDKISIKNFIFYEVVNQGIQTSFDIKVKYQNLRKDLEDDLLEYETIECKSLETETRESLIDEKHDLDEDTIILNEVEPCEAIIIDDEVNQEDGIAEKTLEAMETELDIEYEESALIIDDDLEKEKEEINKKYEKILKDVLDSRTDNFLEESPARTSNVVISEQIEEKKSALNFVGNLRNEYSTIKVCYFEREVDLDQICKRENISLDRLYQLNKNNRFIENRRIIVR